MKYYQFNYLLQEEGWLNDAFVGVDDAGIIQYISLEKPEEATSIDYVKGAALPGFQNAHSHAFQYGMAGMAEIHAPGAQDDFWSWREAMYQCALSFSPEQVQVVATALYTHLLRNGYTHVAEFHYLHHDKDGQPYSNLAEIGERLVAAAKEAGIKITLVPIFYQKGGFDKEPQPRQRRFISQTIDDYFKLLDSSALAVQGYKDARLGFGVHSLRAVEADDIYRTWQQGPADLPFHLHAGEQLKEVEDCIAKWNKRPIEWLLENLPVNDRFHIVHCTHMTADETRMLAQSGANAVLCPGTEGNLGDGIFNLTDYAGYGGNWSIGTDSHISLNPLEDLRWLDYAQRLITHRRNTFADGASVLINKTIKAGRKAMYTGASGHYFEIGQSLDAAIYDMARPLLAQAAPQHLLPAILYTGDPLALLGTMVNGRWIEFK